MGPVIKWSLYALLKKTNHCAYVYARTIEVTLHCPEGEEDGVGLLRLVKSLVLTLLQDTGEQVQSQPYKIEFKTTNYFRSTVFIRKPDDPAFEWPSLGHFLGPTFKWSGYRMVGT